MIRLSLLGLFVIVAICCVAPAMAATPPAPAPAAQVTLTADPYLNAATVTTSIVEAHFCRCPPLLSCPFVNYDCGGGQTGCCHCAGPNPNQLTCVGNG